MSNYLKFLLIILAACGVFSGCAKNEWDLGQNSETVLRFSVNASRQTKATATDNVNVVNSSFGVYAYSTGQQSWEEYYRPYAIAPDLMVNQEVTYNGEEWTYGPLKYWSNTQGEKISFFAYWPYGSSAMDEEKEAHFVRPNAKQDGVVELYFKQTGDVTKMCDFIVATKTDVTKQSGPVQLPFEHVLTRLNFSANVGGNVSSDVRYFITGIKLLSGSVGDNRLYSDHRYSYSTSGEGGGWLEDLSGVFSELDATPLISRPSYGPDPSFILGHPVPSDGSTTELFSDGEYLFLIPPRGKNGIQTEEDIKVEVSYTVVSTENGTQITTPTTSTISLPMGSLVEGMAYNICLNFGADAIIIEAEVEDWEEEETWDIPSVVAASNSNDDILAAFNELNNLKSLSVNVHHFMIKVPGHNNSFLNLYDAQTDAFEDGDMINIQFLGKGGSENLVKPDGNIRDTDMLDEMVNYSSMPVTKMVVRHRLVLPDWLPKYWLPLYSLQADESLIRDTDMLLQSATKASSAEKLSEGYRINSAGENIVLLKTKWDVQARAGSYIINPGKDYSNFAIPLSRNYQDYLCGLADNETRNEFDSEWTMLLEKDWEIETIWKTWEGGEEITGQPADDIFFEGRDVASYMQLYNNVLEQAANVTRSYSYYVNENEFYRGQTLVNCSYAAINIPSSIPAGNNALIALRQKSTGKVWHSWLLWFTDYDPYTIYEDEMNGSVHSYLGESFTGENGINYGNVVMDRNLGATITGVSGNISPAATQEDAQKLYGLFYQYGRNVPFRHDQTIISEQLLTPEMVTYGLDHASDNAAGLYLEEGDGDPSIFYTNWDKPYWNSDPCPPGWIMPDAERDYPEICTWSDFTNSSFLPASSSSASGTFPYKGRIYNGEAFYPAAGRIVDGHYVKENTGYYWGWDNHIRDADGAQEMLSVTKATSDPYRRQSFMTFDDTNVQFKSRESHISQAFSIRCVSAKIHYRNNLPILN